jgi:hypothetical protein
MVRRIHEPYRHGESRPLTDGERRAVSPGLAGALSAVGAQPRLIAHAHPAARIAALWRGDIPTLTRGDVIWWPGATADLSEPGFEREMAVLQHELQHVLDYRTGRLTAVGYLCSPRHWTYRWERENRPPWDDLGAEQRGSLAERLWLAERDFGRPDDLEALRRVIAWA